MEQRPYQKKLISDARLAIRKNLPRKSSLLLVMPTGAGKTVVFSAIAKAAVERGNNVLILVHRRELIRQASEKLSLINVDHGVIAAGFEQKENPIQIASVQTLIRRLEKVCFIPNLIIIDEAHHAVAGSWSDILKQYSSATTIGVTATPIRLDGRGLGSKFTDLILGPTIPQLVDKGYLCPHKVFASRIHIDLAGLKVRAGDYEKNKLSETVNKPSIIGDAVYQYQKHGQNKPAIAFCVDVNHARAVTQSFNSAGVPAGLITGDMKTKDRDEVIDKLSTGKIKVLASIDVVSEGTDIPDVAVAILLRPTKSEGLYMQQVGRILRPKPNKVAVVLDHVGNTITHGFVDDIKEWSLDPVKKRKSKGEAPPAVQTCKQCFAVFKPQRICPCCGYEQPIKPRQLQKKDGELLELKKEEVRERLREKKRQQGKAQTLQELIVIGKQRGYKSGWAHFVYNNRQTKWARKWKKKSQPKKNWDQDWGV